MSALLILSGGFGLTALSSELFLRRRKLQSALGRVVIVHAAGLATVLVMLTRSHGLATVPVLIFWSGALLSWFGIRSHLESSILLRMIHMLRRRPMTRRDMTTQYESSYGRTQRIEDLVRAGLLVADPQGTGMKPTRKGLLITRLVLRLR